MNDLLIKFEAHLDVLSLKPGDRCVLRFPGSLNQHTAQRIQEVWAQYAPGVPLIILDRGSELAVLRAEECAG